MTSITIYTPFTYCITFIPTGQRYYGVRYAKDCHPDQLWTTYFTSSKTISDLIEKYGKDSFTTQIRKTFNDGDTANAWETKFLTKINAAKHPEWINVHNGGSKFHCTPESIQKMMDSRIRNTNSNTSESLQKILEQRSKETIVRKKRVKKPNSPESIQMMVETRKSNGTYINTPESIQKCKDTKKKKGTINASNIPFLSIVASKKSYAKCSISRFFPEFKQYY